MSHSVEDTNRPNLELWVRWSLAVYLVATGLCTVLVWGATHSLWWAGVALCALAALGGLVHVLLFMAGSLAMKLLDFLVANADSDDGLDKVLANLEQGENADPDAA